MAWYRPFSRFGRVSIEMLRASFIVTCARCRKSAIRWFTVSSRRCEAEGTFWKV